VSSSVGTEESQTQTPSIRHEKHSENLRGREEEKMNDEIERERFFFDLFTRLYDETRSSNALINEKTHNMLVMTGTITAILVGLFYNFLGTMQQAISSLAYAWVVTPISLGLVMFFLALVQGVRAYQPWESLNFEPEGYLRDHEEKSWLDLMSVTVSTLADIVNKNRVETAKKADQYKWMLRLMVSGLFLFLGAFIALALALARAF
jgi:hypothetical protein